MTAAAPAVGATLVPALAVGAAVLVLTAPAPGPRRLAQLDVGRSSAVDHPVIRAAEPDPEIRGRGLAAVGAGAGVLMLVDGGTGLVLGGLIATISYLVLGRLEPRAVVAERERLTADLPVGVHLLASALVAGATPVRALDVVSASLGEPIASHLRRVAAEARLGGDLAAIWRSVPLDSELAPLARTMARALDTGAPLADALDRLAMDLRARRRFEVDRRARSVGVRAAAPLGLCFLPAFLLIGVVPVVIGVATTIFATVG